MFLDVFLTKLTQAVTALCQVQHACLKTLGIFLVVINIWQSYLTKVANNIARGFYEECIRSKLNSFAFCCKGEKNAKFR